MMYRDNDRADELRRETDKLRSELDKLRAAIARLDEANARLAELEAKRAASHRAGPKQKNMQIVWFDHGGNPLPWTVSARGWSATISVAFASCAAAVWADGNRSAAIGLCVVSAAFFALFASVWWLSLPRRVAD